MSQLGELCLWAAPGLVALAMIASLAGAWTGRGDLAALGGRAALGGAVLLLLALLGLGAALVGVDLRYLYVANHSGYSLSTGWRAAGLWSGAAGGVLVVTCLMALVATLSDRVGGAGRTRHRAARTGVLAMLALGGLLMALVAAHPFARPPQPVSGGMGLPLAIRDPAWQLQLWMAYAASALAGFAFAGAVAEQLLESAGGGSERRAMGLAAGLLTLAVLTGAWRAYAASGELVGADARAFAGALIPAALLALAYLHAPPSPAAPVGSDRWQRALGVAVFPATMGATGALLGGAGGEPPMVMWAGGLVLGLLCGALAGLTPVRTRAGTPTGASDGRSEAAGTGAPGRSEGAGRGATVTPGLGFDGLGAGLLLVMGAGLGAAVLAAPDTIVSEGYGRAIALYGSLLVALPAGIWMIARPARGRRVWPAALAAAFAGAVAIVLVTGVRAGPVLGGAILGLVAMGGVADLLRLGGAGAAGRRSAPMAAAVHRTRSSRRAASVAGHVGFGLLVLGLWGEMLGRTVERRIEPGAELVVPAGAGSVSVRYLGLSRYRTADAQKFVATFRASGATGSGLLAPELGWEWATGLEVPRPSIDRGVFRDVLVGIEQVAPQGGEEEITARLSVRPLANLVWIGGLMIGISAIVTGGLPLRWRGDPA